MLRNRCWLPIKTARQAIRCAGTIQLETSRPAGRKRMSASIEAGPLVPHDDGAPSPAPRPKSCRVAGTKSSTRREESGPGSQQAHDEDAIATRTSKTVAKRRVRVPKVAPRLIPPTSPKHCDLESFLQHAEQTALDSKSAVYKGTHFEYTVAKTLSSYGIALSRTGRSNDLGIDLMGLWTLPGKGRRKKQVLPVIVQCKAFSRKPTPSLVRELEGAYAGAPAGWRSGNALALLITRRESTKGVRAAIQRSRWPMGLLQITSTGELKQVQWNVMAAEAGLEGLGATVVYTDSTHASAPLGEDGKASQTPMWSVGLTWLGRWLGGEKNGLKATGLEVETPRV